MPPSGNVGVGSAVGFSCTVVEDGSEIWDSAFEACVWASVLGFMSLFDGVDDAVMKFEGGRDEQTFPVFNNELDRLI